MLESWDKAQLLQVAHEFGTPCYVYDAAILRRNYTQLSKALGGTVQIFYSLKANPNRTLCSLLKAEGAGADVSSLLELETALSAGFAPENILFVGPAKSDEELLACIRHKIKAIVCESFNEFERIQKIAKALGQVPALIFRINPDFVCQDALLKMGGRPSQFGIDLTEFRACLPELKQLSFKIKGLHIYNGTRILDPKVVAENTASIFALASELEAALGYDFEVVDIGGGLGIPYFDNEKCFDIAAFGALIQPVIEAFSATHPTTSVVMESGRYLVGTAGLFLSRVVDQKASKGEDFLITDGGTNCHLAAVGMGGLVKRNFPIQLLSEHPATPTEKIYQITGPLCTPGDLVGKNVALSCAQIGDVIMILHSGAYGPSASPILFLGHGYPTEVLLEEGCAVLIRKHDSVEDMLRNQVGPIF